MRITVLDSKKTQKSSWFLGKITLWDYLSSVSKENFDFDVQRGIVKNKYLDNILQSIQRQEPIPPITITSDTFEMEGSNMVIGDDSFNILDGLQRTYRLWLYKQISSIALETSHDDLFGGSVYSISDILSRLRESDYYIPGVLSVSFIKSLLDNNSTVNVSTLQKIYEDFDIYLYIWCGLEEKDIIKKMLILNAGQRKVSIGHQYELMFLKIYKDYELFDKVTLVREKDERYGKTKNGDREIGDFIFSTTIIGIQSLIEGKPMRLSSDNLELDSDDDFISEDEVNQYFNQPFLNQYLESLYDFDDKLCNYDTQYLKWFVKDTTISGILGAIGLYLKSSAEDINLIFKKTMAKLLTDLENRDYFQLKEFYLEYNNLSSTRINIGEKVREAIFRYTLSVLQGNIIKWSEAFNTNKRNYE